VDIGGTFTDVVLQASDGRAWSYKLLASAKDQSQAVLEALNQLTRRAGVSLHDISEVVHGTTVATNAILEGKGAKTALLTTAGFRDVLELRRLRVPELFALSYRPPEPLAPRRFRLEVQERMAADGSVVKAPDRRQVREALRSLDGAGIEAVAVCFLHSYANHAHERLAGEVVASEMPGAYLSLSVDVLPEIREYERTSTTVVNAYVGPLVSKYLDSLDASLKRSGFRGKLRVMRSDGGIMSAQAASRLPAQIIESGPAAGAVAAARAGLAAGTGDVISFDMGGTTAKASLVEGGRPSLTTEYEVGAGINLSSKLVKGRGHALKLPVIDLAEVGAGGGSIVWRDGAGALKVGPHSAGSSPGPACYGLGGTDATITDANLCLGYLNPVSLGGGTLSLKPDLAEKALARLAGSGGRDALLRLAYGIHEIANSTMVRAIKAVSTYRGRDPRDFALLAFGGSGPIHACSLARALSMPDVLVPPAPGVFSALGLLDASPEYQFVRTCILNVAKDDVRQLEPVYEAMTAEASAQLAADGFDPARCTFTRRADMRFSGQSYELTVDVNDGADGPALDTALREQHMRSYGHVPERAEAQVVNARLVVTVGAEKGSHRAFQPGSGRAAESSRKAYFGERWGVVETPVIPRDGLAGFPARGPLLIDEFDSTTVIPPDCAARLDDYGNITLTVGGPSAK
jgi:N-methylhydantoinase A